MLNRLLLIGLLITGPALANELRQTTTINGHTPTVQEVESALFPQAIAKLKDECVQMEKIGLRCQSVIPKSSLDTVQITFARGSSTLSKEGKDFLRSVGTALQRKSGVWSSLVVEGHADATGSPEANQQLSQARAEAAKNFLVSEFKLSNISAVGKSSDHLRDAENPTSSINRRIEIVPTW